MSFKKITYTHVRREQNKEADKLVNEALDKEIKK
jgi:ribonuclease HI